MKIKEWWKKTSGIDKLYIFGIGIAILLYFMGFFFFENIKDLKDFVVVNTILLFVMIIIIIFFFKKDLVYKRSISKWIFRILSLYFIWFSYNSFMIYSTGVGHGSLLFSFFLILPFGFWFDSLFYSQYFYGIYGYLFWWIFNFILLIIFGGLIGFIIEKLKK